MFQWTDESIRWYREAAEYSDYHRRLARLLRPRLGPAATVCDLGCGLGYLSAELALFVRRVTAIDRDARALGVLRERIAAQGLRNVEAVEGDCYALPHGAVWDVAVLCFFGRLSEHLPDYLPHVRGTLLAVVSADARSDIAPSGRSRAGKERARELRTHLDAAGVPYAYEGASLEFGQPFGSPDEAEAYIRHYAHAGGAEARAHLGARLMPLPDGRYYLPNRKELGIFTLDAAAAKAALRMKP